SVARRRAASAAAVRGPPPVVVVGVFTRPRWCRWPRRPGRWGGTTAPRCGGSSPAVCAGPGRGPGRAGRARPGVLQAVDGRGGGGKDLVQVGGGVVGGAFGQRVPLFAFAAPVEQVGAGEHELVAVVAVQVPRAGAAVDDGLEGAEAALGRGGAAGQVD